jgi:hypothetical protein
VDHKNPEIADTSSFKLGFNVDRKEENYTEEELATRHGSYPTSSEIMKKKVRRSLSRPP